MSPRSFLAMVPFRNTNTSSASFSSARKLLVFSRMANPVACWSFFSIGTSWSKSATEKPSKSS